MCAADEAGGSPNPTTACATGLQQQRAEEEQKEEGERRGEKGGNKGVAVSSPSSSCHYIHTMICYRQCCVSCSLGSHPC